MMSRLKRFIVLSIFISVIDLVVFVHVRMVAAVSRMEALQNEEDSVNFCPIYNIRRSDTLTNQFFLSLFG